VAFETMCERDVHSGPPNCPHVKGGAGLQACGGAPDPPVSPTVDAWAFDRACPFVEMADFVRRRSGPGGPAQDLSPAHEEDMASNARLCARRLSEIE